MAVNLEALKKKLDELEGKKKTYDRASKVQLWKADCGEYRVRILPWKCGDNGMPFAELQFYWLGVGKNVRVLAPCQFDKPDPVADLRMKLFQTKDPNDREVAKKLFASVSPYCAIIVRGEEDRGPLVWALSKDNYKKLVGYFFDSDYNDITNVAEGFDIKVKITVGTKVYNGKKVNDVQITPATKSSILSTDPEQAQKWVDDAPDIKDLYPQKSYEEVIALLDDFIKGPQTGVINEQGGDSPPPDEQEEKKTQDEKPVEKKADKKSDAKKDSPPAKKSKDVEQKVETDVNESLDKGFKDLDSALADLEK